MARRVFLYVLLLGCGDVESDKPDARVADAPSVPDAMIDAPQARCNPTAQFQPKVAVTALNTTASDEGGWLSPDELTIYFDSTRTGTLGAYDVFMATRPTRDADFGNITPVMGVNDAGHQRGPMVTADGLTLVSLIGTAPNYDIGIATRASTSATFSSLTAVAALNTTMNDEPNWISADGNILYMDSNRDGKYKIFRVTRSGNTWGTPVAISGVNLNNNVDDDSAGVVMADELTLFFSSSRAGGVGSSDIWMSTRATTADAWGAPLNVQALNTTGLDGVSWISADGCVMYGSGGACTTAGCSYDISTAKRGS